MGFMRRHPVLTGALTAGALGAGGLYAAGKMGAFGAGAKTAMGMVRKGARMAKLGAAGRLGEEAMKARKAERVGQTATRLASRTKPLLSQVRAAGTAPAAAAGSPMGGGLPHPGLPYQGTAQTAVPKPMKPFRPASPPTPTGNRQARRAAKSKKQQAAVKPNSGRPKKAGGAFGS